MAFAQDRDGDGLNDYWENQYFHDRAVRNARADFDRDHVTAAQEEKFGLNPLGQWKVHEIPRPPGVAVTLYARALNDNGVVLIYTSGSSTPDLLYDANADPPFIEIPGLEVAYDLNDHGEVCGRVRPPS